MKLLSVDQTLRSDPSCARLPHDERYEKGSAYVNGQYCALTEAAIPLLDAGFTQSDGVYDKATVMRGRFFRLQDHFDRFARSCEKFRLRNPHTECQMVEIFSRLLRLTGLKSAGVWWCVTRGLLRSAGRHDDRDARGNPDDFENRFYARVDPYVSLASQEQRNRGLNLMISERYIRIPPRAVDPTAKNFHWQDMKLSLFEAKDQGKDWSVLTDAEGYLTEPPGANIFVIKDRQLYTPDSGCLEGITRKTALDLAVMMGIAVHVERVHAQQLRQADGAFITSSAGGIMPVNSVDGIVLGDVEGPGELAAQFHNRYWEKMWEGWKCTAVDYQGSR